MYGMYTLREEAMKVVVGQSAQEKVLFHVTTESRAMEALDSGLDWRRTRRNKFGCGVSFSDDADYANYYADKFTSEGIIIIVYRINVYFLLFRSTKFYKYMNSPLSTKTRQTHSKIIVWILFFLIDQWPQQVTYLLLLLNRLRQLLCRQFSKRRYNNSVYNIKIIGVWFKRREFIYTILKIIRFWNVHDFLLNQNINKNSNM